MNSVFEIGHVRIQGMGLTIYDILEVGIEGEAFLKELGVAMPS